MNFKATLAPAQADDRLEADELFTFVQVITAQRTGL